MPHWVTAEVPGYLRANSTSYTEAYLPYWKAIADVTVKNQITSGGPIIAIQVDNEYIQPESPGNPGKMGYFEDLQKVLREEGVVIPTTYNDPGQMKSYAQGQGKVDLYGLDSYSNGFDCLHPEVWQPVTTNYYEYHMETNPEQPWFIPEFQAGSLDPWGPAAGYENCRKLTGPDYESVFHLNLWANNVKLVSYYMGYGGTSWGHIPFHKVYTSYDLGASISEPRQLTSKYTELKRQGLFIRSAPDFITTDVIGTTANGKVNVTGASVFATFLQNPATKAGFYIARQLDSTSTATVSFGLSVSTSAGPLTLPLSSSSPGITLKGRQSKVIVTDFTFGSSKALYSTASILFAGKIGSRDVLHLYGDSGVEHEAAIKFKGGRKALKTAAGNGQGIVQLQDGPSGYTLIKFKPTDTSGVTTVWESDSTLILISSADQAGSFFSPAISGSGTYGNFWQFGSKSAILVQGPYLVRSASVKGSTIDIVGDIEKDTTLTVVAPTSGISTITFNGKKVTLSSGAFSAVKGIFVGKIAVSNSVQNVKVPSLSSGWRFTDALPEIKSKYSDDKWTVATKKDTNSPYKPYYGDADGPVLYGCDYGYCEGHVLWRGRFTASGSEKAVNLSINGGEAFAASVWLNGKFIKTTYGKSTYPAYIWPILDPALEETDETFTFPAGALLPGKENVLTVLQDNMGLNQTNDWNAETSKSPRGIRGYKLIGADTTFTSWKNWRASMWINGWLMGRVVGNLGPQFKFPVHEGILDYRGKNTIALAIWSMEDAPVSVSVKIEVDAVYDSGKGDTKVIGANEKWVKRLEG
ncbi:hypothetical protein FRC02_008727 [Tulasnella sp. 418]|nr:hypothetical protein FRC02_008727 [Tulasnella sp. 418]